MIDKKGLFGGGLSLGYITVILSCASNVVATEDNIIKEAEHTLTQMHWRIQAYNMMQRTKWQIATNQPTDRVWILDEKYKKSIMEVVGQAMADCVTEQNEFKDKKAGDIITFEGTTPWTYEQKNWNAVVLYNYVFCEHTGKNKSCTAYRNAIDKLKNHYETLFCDNGFSHKIALMKQSIDDAVTVIEMYEKAFYWKPAYIRLNLPPACEEVSKKLSKDKDGKNGDKVRLYEFADRQLIQKYDIDNKYEKFLENVKPLFYYRNKTVYLAGYDGPVEGTWQNKTLNPISKAEEVKYNGTEGPDSDNFYKKLQEAKEIEARLKRYRDEIFYGLVEVSPLYCD